MEKKPLTMVAKDAKDALWTAEGNVVKNVNQKHELK